MTSPSNRRRSIESTISLIREAAEGSGDVDDPNLQEIAERVSSPTTNSKLPFGHGRAPSV